jgi:uncharacterized repeat protein (TIGR01451 family)
VEPDNLVAGQLDNTATADSDQTDPVEDSEQVPVVQNPNLVIDKTVVSVIDTNANGLTDAGDVINYNVNVANTGNVTLTGVEVSDPLLGGSLASGVTLAVGADADYTGSYTILQSDVDTNGNNDDGDIDNTATADSNETEPVDDSEEVPIDYVASLAIDKTVVEVLNPDGTTDKDGIVDQVGDVIHYNVNVENTGTVTLTGVTVVDPLTGQDISGVTLDVGTNADYTGSYTVTANDFLTDATAEPNDTQPGFIDNTATVDSNETEPESDSESVPIRSIAPAGQITPTGTACADYISGMAENFEDYYDFQNGDIQYGDSNKAPGVINNTNPGVFFYYTGLSGRLTADADGDGDADPFSVTIDQSNDNSDFSLFETVKNDVKLYEIIDTNGNGEIDYDLGETCQQVRKGVQIKEVDGDVTISYTPTNPDALYVIGVKYDTDNTIKGTVFDPADSPTVNYDFVTYFNQTPVEADNPDSGGESGVNLSYKFDDDPDALTLDGTPTSGADVLTDAALAKVVDAAIDYWAKQGVDYADLQRLLKTDVRIEDLGGNTLAETTGVVVRIDDDAAGYGWSDSLDEVDADQLDLLSAVTHEFGHVLGYDHSLMDADLAVGERELALDDAQDSDLSGLGIDNDLLFG